MTTVLASLALLALAGIIVRWANRSDPARLPITRERRRMLIELARRREDG